MKRLFPISVYFVKYCFVEAVGKGEQWDKPQNPHIQRTRKDNLLGLALGEIKQIKKNHFATPAPFSSQLYQ